MGGGISFQISISNNGPVGIDRRAMGRGQSRGISPRRIEGMIFMSRYATKPRGEKLPLSNNFSPKIDSDGDLRAEFSALILPFPDKVLATSADCSPETVKCWKAERSFPQGRHLMKLVADFPKIQAWHDRRTGRVNNPQSQSELFALLEQVMSSDTAEGRAMRARYQQIVAEAK
jgi:hypothetical protein